MQTLLQKVHVDPQHSFACRTYRTPEFETSWHTHEEFELICFIEGTGTAMIGDYVGTYAPGDSFFIAGNLPHWFRKADSKQIGAAKVLQCKPELLLEAFDGFPEWKGMQQFLQKKDAIALEGKLLQTVPLGLDKITVEQGFQRMLLLLQMILDLATSKEYKVLSRNFTATNDRTNPAIEKIIAYSFKHFLEPISLSEIAAVAEMSVPGFCRFFKKNIKKTYFNFLQELRIGHACKLLNDTEKPILEICYDSGYNSWAHFSKQFKQIKGMAPSAYRKQFI
jgi:AraC-like DNA-binding protein